MYIIFIQHSTTNDESRQHSPTLEHRQCQRTFTSTPLSYRYRQKESEGEKKRKKKRNRTVLVEVLNTTDQLIYRVFCGAMFKHFHTLMNSNQFIC